MTGDEGKEGSHRTQRREPSRFLTRSSPPPLCPRVSSRSRTRYPDHWKDEGNVF